MSKLRKNLCAGALLGQICKSFISMAEWRRVHANTYARYHDERL